MERCHKNDDDNESTAPRLYDKFSSLINSSSRFDRLGQLLFFVSFKMSDSQLQSYSRSRDVKIWFLGSGWLFKIKRRKHPL
uniref:Uncharacterized protein n=1 Tax=Romanomermis culicivorax TaxID=13658 RepID=A0A915IM07_ROMCU